MNRMFNQLTSTVCTEPLCGQEEYKESVHVTCCCLKIIWIWSSYH